MDLLKGTLDVLILKTLSWGPLHGYAISKSIRQQTRTVFSVEEGGAVPGPQAAGEARIRVGRLGRHRVGA